MLCRLPPDIAPQSSAPPFAKGRKQAFASIAHFAEPVTCDALHRAPSSSPMSNHAKKYPHRKGEDISLVDATRENWNGILEEIVRLSERLEKLGIDGIMEADDV